MEATHCSVEFDADEWPASTGLQTTSHIQLRTEATLVSPLVTPSAFKFDSGSPYQLTPCRLNSVAVLWSAKSGTIIQNSRSGNKTACVAFAKINTYKLTKWNSESDLPISQVNAAADEWD
jgi:hypothetical protein